MTRNTLNVVKRIVDKIITDNYDIQFIWKDVIGGKRYTSVLIGDEYKLIFSGSKGSVLRKIDGKYELEDISLHNFYFIFNFCKLYKKLFNNYTITKKTE